MRGMACDYAGVSTSGAVTARAPHDDASYRMLVALWGRVEVNHRANNETTVVCHCAV
jgi:hypothetical protein